MIVVAILVFVLLIGIEVPRLLKQKMRRELVVFGGLVLIGMLWTYSFALDIPLPKVTEPFEMVLEPVYLFLEEQLGTTRTPH